MAASILTASMHHGAQYVLTAFVPAIMYMLVHANISAHGLCLPACLRECSVKALGD
jgi:hypothetical protein